MLVPGAQLLPRVVLVPDVSPSVPGVLPVTNAAGWLHMGVYRPVNI